MRERVESPDDPVFQAACALSTRLGRAAAGRFLVEGENLVRQALASPLTVHAVFATPAAPADLAVGDSPVYPLDERLMPRLLGLDYPTRVDVAAMVERRVLSAMPTAGLMLVADSVQDPRNVGVLLRTAEAAGVAAVALSDDAADPFGRPAVRSSTGSILREPVYLMADTRALLEYLQVAGVRVVATSARASVEVWDIDLTGDVAILVGNETTGLSTALRDVADAVVRLPVVGAASSLNVTVAAGAMLYEAVRQRRQSAVN